MNLNFLTSLCILGVLQSHYGAYTKYFLLSAILHLSIVFFSVGGFVFLSGYKLTKSKTELNFKNFLKNRLSRLFLPYLLSLSLFTLFIQHTPNLKDFLLYLTGLQVIFPKFVSEGYLTIWFIGLIFSYYYIFYILKKYLNNIKLFLGLSFLIFLTTLLLHTFFHKTTLFSLVFFRYYFFFIFGMIFAKYEKNILQLKIFKILSPLLLSFIVLGFYFPISIYNPSASITIATSYIILPFVYIRILLWSQKINEKWNKFFKFISFSSFFIFLFHRPIWQIMTLFWSKEDYSLWQEAYILVFGTIVIFFFSYYGQLFYNKITNR